MDNGGYYFGPVCSASGGVSRGYFLDFDESQLQGPSSSDVLKFVNSVCTSCAAGHGDVYENVYNSSFHCPDRYMTAVTMEESTSWRASQQNQQEHSGDREDAGAAAKQMELADEVCYKTSFASARSTFLPDPVRGVKCDASTAPATRSRQLARVALRPRSHPEIRISSPLAPILMWAPFPAADETRPSAAAAVSSPPWSVPRDLSWRASTASSCPSVLRLRRSRRVQRFLGVPGLRELLRGRCMPGREHC